MYNFYGLFTAKWFCGAAVSEEYITMNLQIIGDGVSVTQSMREYITKGMKGLKKNFLNIKNVVVRVVSEPGKETSGYIQVSISLVSGAVVNLSQMFERCKEGSKFYGAFKEVSGKVAQQLSRKTKKMHRNVRANSRASSSRFMEKFA